jgi:hypothetical protein
VLGYLLAGGTWRDDVTARDFAGEREQTVWHAMQAIRDAGDQIDRMRLIAELGDRKAQHIGLGYLADMGEGCYPGMQIEPYVAKLQECSCKRDLLQHAHRLIASVHSGIHTADELITMGTEAFAGLGRNRNHQEPPSAVPRWPDPLHEDAFHGVAGDLVRAILPQSEADPAALLLQVLVGFGNLTGRGPYVRVEGDQHHSNEYVVLVGITSGGRKGTAWGRVRDVLESTDQHWAANCLLSGLGSGEALIEALSDADHRRLVYEPEFARVLAVMAREGTTLSAIFRQCWDYGTADIKVRGKGEVHARGAHLSAICHVTKDELLRKLSDTELANGFANRFLFACAARSQELPFGGDLIPYGDTLERLSQAADHTRKLGNTRIQFHREAGARWKQVYHDLTVGRPGLFGDLTARRAPHVLRLSLDYALLDCASEIRIEHLQAALAVWRYCEDSTRFVWGDALSDATADELLRALQAAGAGGMTRWHITNHFGRNKPAAELDRAIAVLTERGLIRFAKEDSGGRPTVRYWAL